MKLTKKQQEMMEVIEFCDRTIGEAFLEFGRYKQFDYRTFAKLWEKGLVTLVKRDYENKGTRPEWVKVKLADK